MLAGRERRAGGREVDVVWQREIDRDDAVVGEEVVEVRVRPCAELVRDRLRPHRVGIADRDDLDPVGSAGVSREMRRADLAESHEPDPVPIAHSAIS